MLPLVRPYEYLIIQCLLEGAGRTSKETIVYHLKNNIAQFNNEMFNHALKYMLETDYFKINDGILFLNNISLDTEFDAYMNDLIDYGLGQFDIDFADDEDKGLFKLWGKYRKEQVQLLLLNNPKDIMLGTKNYNGIVYIYVTVEKANSIKEELKYMDGYLDEDTFQWETVANIKDSELAGLKSSKRAELFVRKVEIEDGITLPFTYIGSGHMEFIEGSKQHNGAYMFRIPMDKSAPEDLYFDFKLPE